MARQRVAPGPSRTDRGLPSGSQGDRVIAALPGEKTRCEPCRERLHGARARASAGEAPPVVLRPEAPPVTVTGTTG